MSSVDTGTSYVIHMVTAGVNNDQEPTQTARTPLLATCHLFQWHIATPFRSGGPVMGETNITSSSSRRPLGSSMPSASPSIQLYESSPTISAIAQPGGIKLRSGMTTAATARQTADADCLAKWQAVNTAEREREREREREHSSGTYVRRFSSTASNIARTHARSHHSPTSSSPTVVPYSSGYSTGRMHPLDRHSSLFRRRCSAMHYQSTRRASSSAPTCRTLELWRLMQGNDPNNPDSMMDYWDALLHVMPTAPEGKHVVNVRTWLAGKVTERSKQEQERQRPLQTLIQALKLFSSMPPYSVYPRARQQGGWRSTYSHSSMAAQMLKTTTHCSPSETQVHRHRLPSYARSQAMWAPPPLHDHVCRASGQRSALVNGFLCHGRDDDPRSARGSLSRGGRARKP